MAIVAPHELTKVKEEHWPGVFGDFRAVVTARRDRRRKSRDPYNHRIADFYDYLLREVDADGFRALQERYLDAATVNRNADIVKYIDPIIWFESKLRMAKKLGLDESRPLRILDLGCGPGHFGVVARFFGHDVTGTDLPERASDLDHIYDALCALYAVRRIPHRIVQMQPMGDLGGRYDLVTALLAAFNVDDNKQPWGVEAWRYFLADVRDNVLNAGGELFLVLTNGKLTEETWAYLSAMQAWSDVQSKQLLIKDLSRI